MFCPGFRPSSTSNSVASAAYSQMVGTSARSAAVKFSARLPPDLYGRRRRRSVRSVCGGSTPSGRATPAPPACRALSAPPGPNSVSGSGRSHPRVHADSGRIKSRPCRSSTPVAACTAAHSATNASLPQRHARSQGRRSLEWVTANGRFVSRLHLSCRPGESDSVCGQEPLYAAANIRLRPAACLVDRR